jgi:hypothetical protein
MAGRKEIIASMEGARIVVENGTARRDEYNFVANQWEPRDSHSWPLPKPLAEVWVYGWNPVDRRDGLAEILDPD